MIHLIFGPQGAGKSTYSKKISLEENAVCFSIDQYMAELYLPDLPLPLDVAWVMERVARCERVIWATAIAIIRASGSVVLDLGLLKVSDRARLLKLAEMENLSVQLHFVNASLETRKARVLSRNNLKDATFSFKVSPEMFQYMEGQFEQPSTEEYALAKLVYSE